MIICPDCKHSINEHGKSCRHNDIINPANWVPCECKLSAETIALAAVAEARREKDIVLQEVLDWLNNAPFDYRNGVEAQGTDEGEFYGHQGHIKLVNKIKSSLRDAAPARSAQSEDGSDTSMLAQLRDAGVGEDGRL